MAFLSLRSVACSSLDCRMCRNNPDRPCKGAVSSSYFENEILKAACGAPIRVEIVDSVTGIRDPCDGTSGAPVPLVTVMLLDGNQFDTLIRDMSMQGQVGAVTEDQIRSCSLSLNKRVCSMAG